MKILQTKQFSRLIKKLHKNQKKELDTVIQKISKDPSIGTQKKGDIADVRVYKFKMEKQLTLVAYTFQKDVLTLTFIYLGPHENFYRDLKNIWNE